ncbi:MerR family transcriptional regulator [Ectobacillus panaciterrae]|uniref:MerR family transcriptional regulator n=1 Tax=Ectobacillus panaciterrae TaxID=363872 RepID=UPI0004154C1E|nr:MerR family transcriptional regulator [Ectobacillus panaciterrae]
MKWLKIDDIAKETGLTKRTIRYYEQIELLAPPERSEGGVRLYTTQDVERLKKIMNARDVLGFSLQELKEYLTVAETVELHRKEYKNSLEESKRTEELKEIAAGLEDQIQMIQEKLEKMEKFKHEMEDLHGKVQTLLKMNKE